MNRARFVVAASLLSAAVCAGVASAAQQAAPAPATPSAQAPALKPVLAGRKFTPPLRGEAVVEFTQPVTKPIQGKNVVLTTIKVRNASLAPIARLQITETWFDKQNQQVAAGRGKIDLLQPGEVGTVSIETPYNPRMNGNGYNFTHANGTVKPAKVKSLDAPADAKEPATRQAAATKPAAKK